ncbi:MAG: sulfatase [bacterium]
MIILGCARPHSQAGKKRADVIESVPSGYSLLLTPPLIAGETEYRDPAPMTVRFFLSDKSIESWKSPPENIIRFPVELRKQARLSFSLGAETLINIRYDDIKMRVEFLPDSTPENPDVKPSTLFETSPDQIQYYFSKWFHLDVPLDKWSPGKGEIRFIVDGPRASEEGITVYWGSPSLYYPNERHHRNILLIGVDTLRRDALSPYGARPEVTPNLTEFCRSATLFMQNRSQSSWTLPSFASMITGKLPSPIGATLITGHISDDSTTIAETLLAKGFATELVCSNTWLGNEESGFQQGMESLWYKYDVPAQEATRTAQDFISRSMGRDWFCFLHLLDPHVPYEPPGRFRELLCDPDYEGPVNKPFSGGELKWKSGRVVPADKDIKQAKDLYEGEVANIDDALVGLFNFLKINNILDDTLIIFSSDHGEEFFDHGGFEHGHTQYDELVHMPLIIRGREFPAGAKVDASVGNIDIFPTILRFIRQPIPDEMPGIPLQDIVAGRNKNDRIVFGEDNTRGDLRKFAVKWPWKCILDYVNGDMLLFNLESDPGETKDLSKEKQGLAIELSKEIVKAMLPERTAFNMWITRGFNEGSTRFQGTLRVPGGIEKVEAFRLLPTDIYSVNDDTVTFDIESSVDYIGPYKHMIITPAKGAYDIEASIRVDGKIDPERFFPYGNLTPEPTCEATMNINDYSLGPVFPEIIEDFPAACFIWGVRGFDKDRKKAELDPETIERLKSLGYLN